MFYFDFIADTVIILKAVHFFIACASFHSSSGLMLFIFVLLLYHMFARDIMKSFEFATHCLYCEKKRLLVFGQGLLVNQEYSLQFFLFWRLQRDALHCALVIIYLFHQVRGNMLHSWWKNVFSRKTRMILNIIGVVLCYLSFALGYNDHKNSKLAKALAIDRISSEFLWTIACYSGCITVSIPILVDTMMDVMHTKKLYNFFERFGIVFGVVCLGFVTVGCRGTTNRTGLYIASYYAHRMLIGSAIMSCLRTYVPNIFSEVWVLFLTLWVVISQVVNCFMIETDYFSSGVLEICGCVVFIVLLSRWSLDKVQSFSIPKCFACDFTSGFQFSFSADDVIASMYVYSFLLILLFQSGYFYYSRGTTFHCQWSQIGYDYLCMYALSVCSYVVVITILPGYVSRVHGRRLQHDLDVKHRYVQHMAHKLVEPISVIDKGLHSLILELDASNMDKNGNADAAMAARRVSFNEYQATLQRTSHEINRILHNLLEDTVQVAAVVDVVRVGDFIKCACEPFVHACGSKNLRLEVLVGCPESCLNRLITVDKIKLTQALREFMSNSIKFTSDGGCIRITANVLSGPTIDAGHEFANILGRQKYLEQFLLIKLADTGDGFAPEVLESVFNEPIKKNNQNDKLSKGGMSLLVVKNIVELHGGFVWVESDGVGCGSTILIQLPIPFAAGPQANSLDIEISRNEP